MTTFYLPHAFKRSKVFQIMPVDQKNNPNGVFDFQSKR